MAIAELLIPGGPGLCTLETEDKEGDTRGDKCAGEEKELGEEAGTDNDTDTAVSGVTPATHSKQSLGAWTHKIIIVFFLLFQILFWFQLFYKQV